MRKRKGSGLIIVTVAGSLLLMAFLALSLAFRSTWVLDGTAKTIIGERARELATSAIRETHYRISVEANDPSSPMVLFSKFRSDEETFSGAVPAGNLPLAKEIIDDAGGYTLVGGVNYEVLFQSCSSAETPSKLDRHGAICLDATVIHEPTGLKRKVIEVYDFRLNLTTTPRYFDGMTVYMDDPRQLVDDGSASGSANGTIEEAIKRLEELRSKNKELITKMKEASSKASSYQASGAKQLVKQLDQAVKQLEAVDSSWPEITLNQSPSNEGGANSLHLFPNGSFHIYTSTEQIELSTLNLPAQVEKRSQEISSQEQAYRSATKDLKEALSKAKSSLPTKQFGTYAQTLTSLRNSLKALLIDDFKAFQDSVIEVSGSDLSKFLPFRRQLNAADLARKASLVLLEQNGDISKQCQELLKAPTADGGVSGLLYIRNPSKKLRLSGKCKGRIVMVVEGDVALDGFGAEDEKSDLVTVISFGRLSVDGTVCASLVPWGSLSIGEGATVRGNVIMKRPSSGMGDRGNPSLRGTINHPLAGKVHRHQAGPTSGDCSALYDGFQHLTLGPTACYADIERK